MNEEQDLGNVLKNQPDGSLENLNLGHVIDTVPYPERDNVLRGLINKLRYGGTISIEGVDLEEINRAMYQGYLEVNDANGLLYNQRRSASSMNEVISLFHSLNLKVIHKRCNNYLYYVKAQRKEPNAQ
jgi:hypothetical protein